MVDLVIGYDFSEALPSEPFFLLAEIFLIDFCCVKIESQLISRYSATSASQMSIKYFVSLPSERPQQIRI